MLYIVAHPWMFFMFFSVPVCGLMLSRFFSTKVLYYICCISTVLLFPILTDYSYVFDNAYAYLIYIILSCLYAFMVKGSTKVVPVTIVISSVLIIIIGCITTFYTALGSITIEREWNSKGYKIRYIKDQGFAGGASMKYELYKYTTVPIFIEQVDAKFDTDTTGSCTVKFELAKFDFNRCSGE